MPVTFPSAEWLSALKEKLNGDSRYNAIARNWEGDILFDIQSGGTLAEPLMMYLDLWHGQCSLVEYATTREKHPKPKFILRSAYNNFTSILLGELDPMTAMMTSKLKVEGNLAYMMRNVPTVLDFVRCAREITANIL
jgi:putative sterol carrier protein